MKQFSLPVACRLFGLFLIGILMIVPAKPAAAAILSNRSIEVADPKPAALTTHTFSFMTETASVVGSIIFEYCANDPLFSSPCTAPPGLNVSDAELLSETGITGFAVSAAGSENRILLSRTPDAATPTAVQYNFGNITNPSTNNSANFVRISTYTSTDGTGSRVDEGGLAFRILTGISTEGYVPPFLLFCAGVTVGLTCDSSSGSYINLGELTADEASAGTSQFAGATNDESGYSVSLFGTTLTAGSHTIPAMSVPAASQPGTSQFGLNLRANSAPDAGQEPVGAGTAAPQTDYGTPNRFQFSSGDIVVSSTLPSDFNRFTTTYMANVSSVQAPGVYTATFTYVAVASF